MTALLDLSCNVQSPFAPFSAGTQPVGFITDFFGLGLANPLSKDLQVYTPFSQTPSYAPLTVTQGQANVVAVVESLMWNGGVSDSLKLKCWISSRNAQQLTALPSGNTSIETLGFLTIDFDLETKVWFEQFYPQLPFKIMAQLATAQGNALLTLSETSTPTSLGNLPYCLIFELIPAASQVTQFLVATSSTAKTVRSWGQSTGIPTPIQTPLPAPIEIPLPTLTPIPAPISVPVLGLDFAPAAASPASLPLNAIPEE